MNITELSLNGFETKVHINMGAQIFHPQNTWCGSLKGMLVFLRISYLIL